MSKPKQIIRSSKHGLKFCNKGKINEINQLISDYRILVQNIIDYLWQNHHKKLNIRKNKLNCPSLADSDLLDKFEWNYSERLKQAAGKQALAMIGTATEKRRKQLFTLKELKKKNENTKYLQRKINLFPLVKPSASKINLELDQRFVDFNFDQKTFTCFVRLKSIKRGLIINIPLQRTKVFDKWKSEKLKQCIRLSENHIYLMFDVKEPPQKKEGDIVGCDQGAKDILTFSDKQKVKKYQGRYELSDVMNILSRKKKGSKAFKRAQEFRKNLVNWTINNINFDHIKELRLEKLHQVGKGKRKSRFLSHWTYTLINDKLMRVSEEKGFLITEVPNEFRSQRCSKCGWVRKDNRKGKTFHCTKCEIKFDADENAASNLLFDLFEIPFWVRLNQINRSGFYWMENGLFDESQESIVPDTEKE